MTDKITINLPNSLSQGWQAEKNHPSPLGFAGEGCNSNQDKKLLKILVTKIKLSRKIQFAAFSLVSIILFSGLLEKLLLFSWHSELYSYNFLIPFMSIYLIYSEKKQIFSRVSYGYSVGGLIMIAALMFAQFGKVECLQLSRNDCVSVTSLGMVAWWIGGFVFFFGTEAFRNAAFPLLFLLLAVPIPSFLLEKVILVLQKTSAETAYWIFKISGVPFSREGFVFDLPGMSIEVAKECSGIRSCLMLFIVSLFAGHVFLKGTMKRLLLALSAIPIAIFKNGLRIVTLSLLGTYVDERILSSSLHKQGGIPFFVLALALLAPIVCLLRRFEKDGGLQAEEVLREI